MAPKRKNPTPPIPPPPIPPPAQVQYDAGRFVSDEAFRMYRRFLGRKVITERGIEKMAPFANYIRMHNWEMFTRNPEPCNVSMACEFLANFPWRTVEGQVLCRGRMVSISAQIINEFYDLPDEDFSIFDTEEEVDWEEVLSGLCSRGSDVFRQLGVNWAHIQKTHLTTRMNVWYSFIASRLMPVTINNEVARSRLLLLNRIRENLPIDVGSTIMREIEAMINQHTGIGFLSLITALCERAGCPRHPEDIRKPVMAILTYDAFARKAKRGGEGSSSSAEPPMPTSRQMDDLSRRMGKLESKVDELGDYFVRWSDHRAKLDSILHADALKAIGPYPTFNRRAPMDEVDEEGGEED